MRKIKRKGRQNSEERERLINKERMVERDREK